MSNSARYGIVADPDGTYSIVMSDNGHRSEIESGIRKYERALKRVAHWRAKETKATGTTP